MLISGCDIVMWKGEHENSALRTFVRLIVLDYKRTRESRWQSVRIHSALGEVAHEQMV